MEKILFHPDGAKTIVEIDATEQKALEFFRDMKCQGQSFHECQETGDYHSFTVRTDELLKKMGNILFS